MTFPLAFARRMILSLLAAGACLAAAACGGSEPSEPNLLGTWIGVYTDTEGAEYDYTLVFNADGSMTATAGVETAPAATGSWTLTGLQVDASYVYDGGQSFTIRGMMSGDGATMTGTYGPGIYPLGLGEFSVEKD